MTEESTDPTAEPQWEELLEDTAAIAAEYRENGWEAVVLEPIDVAPSERDDRFGLDVWIPETEYETLETLVETDDAAFGDAEVYYRPAEGADRRFALAVERDETNGTAVCIPLTYSIGAARPVFERALVEEELLVHVRSVESGEGDQWIAFSHDDPSLFLEESDVRSWDAQ